MAHLDNRQKAYLDAMGIDIWIPARGQTVPEPAPDLSLAPEPTPKPQPLAQNALAETSQPETPLPGGSTAVDVSNLDWEQLVEVVSQCQLCELHSSRTQTVFGVGNRQAEVMIIGEAPGADEDKQGEPFVGRAGQLLNAMLRAVGFQRQDVYIANILKCRPPDNRDPGAEEAQACWPYLERQIKLLQPKVILALGRIAAQHLLHTNTSLSRLRGKQHYLDDINIPVIVTYHPAYLLRSPQEKRKTWDDLKLLMSKLAD